MQDVSNNVPSICGSGISKRTLKVHPGQSIHLRCYVNVSEVLINQDVKWHHNGDEIVFQHSAAGEKLVETSEKGLVIMNINSKEYGLYDCYVGDTLSYSYNVMVNVNYSSAHVNTSETVPRVNVF